MPAGRLSDKVSSALGFFVMNITERPGFFVGKGDNYEF
jgi:hypothetical protein